MIRQIKHRFTDKVIFEAEIPDSIPSGMVDRVLLEQAVAAGANLTCANLYLFNLSGANLSAVDLRETDLRASILRGADMRGAKLQGADTRGNIFSGAELAGADFFEARIGSNLSNADVRNAKLRGAILRDGLPLVGERSMISIGPIGWEQRTVFGWVTDKGLRVETGCFFGTREDFIKRLHKTHADNIHAKEYLSALAVIDKHFELWGA